MRGQQFLKPRRSQSGASLLIALIMLIAVMLLGTAASRMALMNEKSSRNDRDRQIAFQAAEAALRDAELTLRGQAARGQAARGQAAYGRDEAFPEQAGKCHIGMCRAGKVPLWNTTDARAPAPWVDYGHFSGHGFPYGAASLPMQAPRYLIELLDAPKSDTYPGDQQRYRITAIGFGSRPGTQVFLQTIHAVHDNPTAPVRLSWREINN